jgi:hypothetical protein
MRITALLCIFSFVFMFAELTAANGTHTGMLNISFVKEVTLSVQPPDMAELAGVTQENQEQVEDFLTSSLRLLDPIMRFFESMVGATPPEPSPA